jgi:hypothetical protein
MTSRSEFDQDQRRPGPSGRGRDVLGRRPAVLKVGFRPRRVRVGGIGRDSAQPARPGCDPAARCLFLAGEPKTARRPGGPDTAQRPRWKADRDRSPVSPGHWPISGSLTAGRDTTQSLLRESGPECGPRGHVDGPRRVPPRASTDLDVRRYFRFSYDPRIPVEGREALALTPRLLPPGAVAIRDPRAGPKGRIAATNLPPRAPGRRFVIPWPPKGRRRSHKCTAEPAMPAIRDPGATARPGLAAVRSPIRHPARTKRKANASAPQ